MTREENLRMTREENLHWIDVEIQLWENECQSKHPIKETLYAARKALEQEPCEDVVSRKAVHDMLENLPVTAKDKWFNWLQKACMRLAELPPATPQQPRKGHWKHIQYEETLCCSECGCRLFDEQTYIPLHYCPNCGAKMQEVKE